MRLLDAGADDYLIKPFEPAELISRCRALLRRSAGHASPLLVIGGDVEIDLARRVVHRGRVVSRQELLDHLYGDAEDTASNVLEVYVAGLRRKLGHDAIRTHRGHGYFVDS